MKYLDTLSLQKITFLRYSIKLDDTNFDLSKEIKAFGTTIIPNEFFLQKFIKLKIYSNLPNSSIPILRLKHYDNNENSTSPNAETIFVKYSKM